MSNAMTFYQVGWLLIASGCLILAMCGAIAAGETYGPDEELW